MIKKLGRGLINRLTGRAGSLPGDGAMHSPSGGRGKAVKKKKKHAGHAALLTGGCLLHFLPVIVILMIGTGIISAVFAIASGVMDLLHVIEVSETVYSDPQLSEVHQRLSFVENNADHALTASEYTLFMNDGSLQEMDGLARESLEGYFADASMSYEAFRAFVNIVSQYEDVRYNVGSLRYVPIVTRTWEAGELADILEEVFYHDCLDEDTTHAQADPVDAVYLSWDIHAGLWDDFLDDQGDWELDPAKSRLAEVISLLRSSNRRRREEGYEKFIDLFSVSTEDSPSMHIHYKEFLYEYIVAMEDSGSNDLGFALKEEIVYSSNRTTAGRYPYHDLLHISYDKAYCTVTFAVSAGIAQNSSWLSAYNILSESGLTWQHVYAAYMYYSLYHDAPAVDSIDVGTVLPGDELMHAAERGSAWQTVWDCFQDMGYTKIQTAAIMGNFAWELPSYDPGCVIWSDEALQHAWDRYRDMGTPLATAISWMRRDAARIGARGTHAVGLAMWTDYSPGSWGVQAFAENIGRPDEWDTLEVQARMVDATLQDSPLASRGWYDGDDGQQMAVYYGTSKEDFWTGSLYEATMSFYCCYEDPEEYPGGLNGYKRSNGERIPVQTAQEALSISFDQGNGMGRYPFAAYFLQRFSSTGAGPASQPGESGPGDGDEESGDDEDVQGFPQVKKINYSRLRRMCEELLAPQQISYYDGNGLYDVAQHFYADMPMTSDIDPADDPFGAFCMLMGAASVDRVLGSHYLTPIWDDEIQDPDDGRLYLPSRIRVMEGSTLEEGGASYTRQKVDTVPKMVVSPLGDCAYTAGSDGEGHIDRMVWKLSLGSFEETLTDLVDPGDEGFDWSLYLALLEGAPGGGALAEHLKELLKEGGGRDNVLYAEDLYHGGELRLATESLTAGISEEDLFAGFEQAATVLPSSIYADIYRESSSSGVYLTGRGLWPKVTFTEADQRPSTGVAGTTVCRTLNHSEIGAVRQTMDDISLSNRRRKVVEQAMSAVGRISYSRLGGRAYAEDWPSSLDCSSFISWVYLHALGIDLYGSRTAVLIGGNGGTLQRIERSELQPGDLLFLNGAGEHVVIYLGKTAGADGEYQVIHCTDSGHNNIGNVYYETRTMASHGSYLDHCFRVVGVDTISSGGFEAVH